MKISRASRLWLCLSLPLAASLAHPARAASQVAVSIDWWDWIGEARVHGSVSYRSGPEYRGHRDRGRVHRGARGKKYRPSRAHRGRRFKEGRSRGREHRGPPFCRSGSGHPVHGWAWCVRKGFAGAYAHPPVSCCEWHRGSLGSVNFRTHGKRRPGRSFGHAGVVEILGAAVVEDLYARVGYRRTEPLHARWHPESGDARVLQITGGSRPLAELTDLDGDRIVDLVYFGEAVR